MKLSLLGALILLLLSTANIYSQNFTRVNKYAMGVELHMGSTFPNILEQQDQWKAKLHASGGFNLLFVNRLNANWSADIGIGLTSYFMNYRGPIDNYIFDFISPLALAGISYSIPTSKRQESFIKLTSGIQMGYQGEFIDEFDAYTVYVEGTNRWYYFLRPEIGMRRYFKKKMKGSRFKQNYEFGTFFRYNINDLGIARIEENNLNLTIQPKGNVIGGYIKFLIPAGNQGIKVKSLEEQLPPIIYSPRFL